MHNILFQHIVRLLSISYLLSFNFVHHLESLLYLATQFEQNNIIMLNGWLLVFKGFYLSVWRVLFCKLEPLYVSECIQNVVVRPLAFRQMQYLCFTLKRLSITLTSKNQNTSKHFISPPQEILNRDLSPRS